jgi:NADPH:quinone reductase-like Zn-dependent oxidoreductase
MFGCKNTSNPWSAGVVAAFEVQFAKAAGARVLTTASRDNEDTLRQLALT